PVFASDLNFGGSRHVPLRRYEQFLVKEGVGAGAAAVVAALVADADHASLLAAGGRVYEQNYGLGGGPSWMGGDGEGIFNIPASQKEQGEMTVRPIVALGNAVLRRKARKVSRIDDSIRVLVKDMIETMRDAPGVGLAAPQIGVPLQVAVVEAEKDQVYVL